MVTQTDWSTNARHLTVDVAKPFTWQADGGHGYPALRAPAATGGKGSALPTPVPLNATGVTTFAVAVEDNELSSSGGALFSLYRGSFYNSTTVTRSALDQWAMRDDSGAGTGSVPDRWFIAAGERRTRLHVYEIDRTADPIVIRRWDNGVPQPEVTVTRGTGTVDLTRLFALSTFSGNGGVFGCDVLFAGVVNGGLTANQRDTISEYFTEVSSEPAWVDGWTYDRAESWLKTFVNPRWESNPALAPAAWQSRAQNTGVLNNATIAGVTDWATGNHLVSPLAAQRFIWQAAGLNGEANFLPDAVDDEVASTSAFELSADHAFVGTAAPTAAIRVLVEHGPNATSGANGTALLSIPPASAEFAGQLRRSSSYYRNRGPWADGAAHTFNWETNPASAGVYWRVDGVFATSSTSNAGTPTGTYLEKLHIGSRAGGLFPVGGAIGIVAVVDGNKAAARVIEHQVTLDYGL